MTMSLPCTRTQTPGRWPTCMAQNRDAQFPCLLVSSRTHAIEHRRHHSAPAAARDPEAAPQAVACTSLPALGDHPAGRSALGTDSWCRCQDRSAATQSRHLCGLRGTKLASRWCCRRAVVPPARLQSSRHRHSVQCFRLEAATKAHQWQHLVTPATMHDARQLQELPRNQWQSMPTCIARSRLTGGNPARLQRLCRCRLQLDLRPGHRCAHIHRADAPCTCRRFVQVLSV